MAASSIAACKAPQRNFASIRNVVVAFNETSGLRGCEMQKPPFELNPEQIEALRQVQAQWQQTRGQSKMLDTSALQANRSGQITPEQRKELISRASGFGMVGLLLWFV